METFTSSLAMIKSIVFDPDVEKFLSPMLAIFIGGIAGIFTFANDFPDKLDDLLYSWQCHMFAAYSGLISLLSFLILDNLNIKLHSLSISEHRYLLASVIGLIGFGLLISTLENSTSSDKEISKLLMVLFKKFQKVLYSQYSRTQNTRLRPKVWEIVKNIQDEYFWDFSLRCIHTAKDINEEKGNALGETYSKYKENCINPGVYKCGIGVDLAKIIGIDLLQQVANESKYLQSRLTQDIQSLDSELQQLLEVKPREKSNGSE